MYVISETPLASAWYFHQPSISIKLLPLVPLLVPPPALNQNHSSQRYNQPQKPFHKFPPKYLSKFTR